MRKSNSPIIRADPKFYEMIKSIQLQRINLGKESVMKPMPPRKITQGFTKHVLFPKIMEDIIKEFK